MGHRTYLIKTTPQVSTNLFEANNLFPFFWLTLITKEDLDKAAPAMRQLYALEEADADDTLPDIDTNVIVDKTAVARNIATASAFIEDNFPEALPLYLEFSRYILQSMQAADKLELNIYSLTAFTGVDDFIDGVTSDLDAIAEQQPDRVSGYFNGEMEMLIGYDCESKHSFRQFSAIYRKDQDKRKTKQTPPEQQAPPAVGKSMIIIIVCLALLYVPYRGYQKEGLSFTVVFLAVVISRCLYYRIKRLLQALRK